MTPARSRAALAHLCKQDPELAHVIERVGPYRLVLQPTDSVFAALAEAIVYQQLHARAAASIFARVCQLFPRPSSPSARALMQLSDDELRAAGLSRAKLAALRDLAEKALSGEIPGFAKLKTMSDEDIVRALTCVRGIGPWTVHMLLMFRLGRPDVLPVHDFGVRKGFALAFHDAADVSMKQLEEHAQRWRPYRSVASWYMWRVLELDPPLRRSATSSGILVAEPAPGGRRSPVKRPRV